MIRALCVVFLLIPVYVSGQAWVEDYKSALVQQQNGDIELAYKNAKASLNGYLQKDGSVSENYASILNLLSILCYESGHYAEGITHAEKSIALREELNDAQKKPLANAYYNLGSLYNISNNFGEAQKAFNQALSIYKDYHSVDHQDVISTHWKLGTVANNLNEIKEAYRYFRLGFDHFDAETGLSADYIVASYDMGQVAAQLDKHREAINHFEILNDVYKQMNDESSASNLSVLLNLGESYKAIGKHQEALSTFENVEQLASAVGFQDFVKEATQAKAYSLQALGRSEEASTIYDSELDKDPMSLNNVASIAFTEGDYEKAEDLYVQALDQLKKDSATVSKDYLEITNNLISLYIIEDKLDEARPILENALKIAKKLSLENTSLYASLLMREGQLLYKARDLEEGEAVLNRAEKILVSSGNGNSKTHINLLNNKALLLYEKGNYRDAQSSLEQAVAELNKGNINYREFSSVFINLATLYQEQGNLIDASNLLNEVSSLYQSASTSASPQYASILRNQANIFIQLGSYDNAQYKLDEAQKKLLSLYKDDEAPVIAVNLDQARLFQAKGEYGRSEKVFLASIDKLENNYGNQNPEYLGALNSVGVLYQTMGNYSKALEYFESSKDGFESLYGNNHPGYVTALENISSTYQLMGKLDKVEPLLLEALEADRIIYGSKHPKYAVSLHNMASLYQKRGQLEKAESYYRQALKIYEDNFGKRYPSYASTLYNLAVVYHERGDYSRAEESFIEVLSIREELLGKSHPEYSFTLHGLASLYHNKGEYRKAFPLYNEAIDNYLYQISEYFPSMSEKEKGAFYSKIKPVFSSFADFAISYYLESGNKEALKEFYDMQLATKAILLNAANKVRDRILNSNNENLITKYQEWTSLKDEVVKHISLTASEKLESGYKLDQLETRINTLEKELSEESQLFASTFEQQQVLWSDVQSALGSGEAALEIIRVEKKYIPDSVMYVGLILRKDETAPMAVVLQEGLRLEQRFYRYFRNAIKFSEPDALSYEKFWAPIHANLSGIQKIFISSDGIYNKLSLSTFYNTASKKYLIDELDIRLVSNTKELLEIDPMDEVKKKYAVVFGSPDFNLGTSYNMREGDHELTRMMGFEEEGIPPLPGTKKEAQNLGRILEQNNWNSTIYLEKNATEENFKGIQNPHLLHVATHGYFLSDIDDLSGRIGLHLNNPEANPLFRSGLLLTGATKGLEGEEKAGEEDGVLSAYEAMNLNLDDTEIVILSACETGLGEIKNGEGVYGLQRSFIVAGANSVMMSLWKVNDETTMELMTLFYENLLEGYDKFTAFKNAQLSIREKYDDPYHWGAFIILGK